MRNNYRIENNLVYIILKYRKKDAFETVIDLIDFDKIKAYDVTFYAKYDPAVKNYYAAASIYMGVGNKPQYKEVRIHKVVMNYHGYNKKVDHIDHNTLNNRRKNLRLVDTKSNTRNRNKKNSNNKSGYRNVCRVGNRWYVQLQVDGKNKCLKTFPLDQLEEAGKYAEEMRQKYYGIFAGNS